MTAAEEPRPDRLDLGRVIRDAFAIVGRQPLTFFGLALLLSGLPGAYADAQSANAIAFTPGLALGVVVAILLSCFLQATLLSAALAQMSGRKAELSESLSAGLNFFLPLLAVDILYGLAVAAGLVLLIVPGVMIAVAWSAAAPTLIAEHPGITSVFGRSAQLTRGNRWRIFALFLIYGIASAVLQALFGVRAFEGGATPDFGRLIGSAIISAIVSAIGLAGAAALYARLRELRDAPAASP